MDKIINKKFRIKKLKVDVLELLANTTGCL